MLLLLHLFCRSEFCPPRQNCVSRDLATTLGGEFCSSLFAALGSSHLTESNRMRILFSCHAGPELKPLTPPKAIGNDPLDLYLSVQVECFSYLGVHV